MIRGASFDRVVKRSVVVIVALLIGLSAATAGIALAEPPSPAPVPSTTSSDDELTDMVMDAIQQGVAAPSTTPVAPPPP